jgi:hypothetical protein
MTLSSLNAVLKHRTIGFSRPADLNDPFDWPGVPDVADYGPFGELTATFKELIWARSMGICSMTRSYNNALMWAHYGDKHRGAVVEIDVEIAGLMDVQANAIPAHFGSVIYLDQPNMSQYAPVSPGTPGVRVGELFSFRLDYYQQLQRIFLSKPLCWAYEEEVRVVKCLRGLNEGQSELESGRFTIVKREDNSEMPAYHLPEGSITNILFGINSDAREMRRIVEDFELAGCRIGRKTRGSYDVQFVPL